MLSPGDAHRDPGGPDLERLRFWRGQHLKARDLNGLGAGEDERQWWHNRAVHDAYGVVAGLRLEASRATEAGVWVQAGLAYDVYGRELAILDPTVAPPPGNAGDDPDEVWALLLRYRGVGDGASRCERGVAFGAQRSELIWRRSRRVSVQDGVVLTRGCWTEERVFIEDDRFQNLPARPLARPRLGHGTTPPGATLWQPWAEPPWLPGASSTRRLVPTARGIEVTINTSAAGFTQIPCYFAWLQGGIWQLSHRLALTAPLPRISAEARDGFTFSLWDPAASGLAPTNPAGADPDKAALLRFLALARQRLYVCWLGIEPARPVGQTQPSTPIGAAARDSK